MLDDFENGSADDIAWFWDEDSPNRVSRLGNGESIISENIINNVPYVHFPGFTSAQCTEIQQLEKNLLNVSKYKHHSAEVAMTFRLDAENFVSYPDRIGYAFSDDDSGIVDVFSDPKSASLFQTAKDVVVVLIHNHPNNTPFSYKDLRFLFDHKQIKLFVVLSHNGILRSLSRIGFPLEKEAKNRFIEMLGEYFPQFKIDGMISVDFVRSVIHSLEDKIIAYKIFERWVKELDAFGFAYQEEACLYEKNQGKGKSNNKLSKGPRGTGR